MAGHSEMLPMAAQLEILRHRLVAVAERMGQTLARTAYSANIKERRDHSCALFDADGRLLAQAAHIPVHLGAMPESLAAIRRRLTLDPGDVVLMNDPYEGGTHLPDITVVAPVYLDARLIGYVANRAHHADVGGIVPGSMGVTRHIDEEGVRLAAVKWYRGGHEDASVLDTLLSAVRTPQERRGDLRAQLAANAVGSRELALLVARYGAGRFAWSSAALFEYAARCMSEAIAEAPDGEYSAEDFLDGDGVTRDRIRIAARIRISAGRAVVDFDGTSPAVAGCVNCPPAVTRSAVVYAFACLAGPRLPHNAGMFEPIELRTPPGSVVHARPPAAVAAGNVETSQRIVDVVFRALAGALPDRIAAGSSGTMASVALGGDWPDGRGAFTYYETIAGGSGASAEGPGQSAVHTHMTNTLNTPVEALESAYPLRVVRYEIRRGSGGAGRFRGGDGVVREIEARTPMAVSVLADRSAGGGFGLSGGAAGAALRVTRIRVDGVAEAWASKVTARLDVGERLRIETPGGGGYGACAAS